MREMRRKEKAIEEKEEMLKILQECRYVTISMCNGNEPYIATLSHGYDPDRNCIYFHCAQKGKKVDILKKNNVVWGQALLDKGYAHGKCDHLYATTQFRGTVTIIEDIEEKEHALRTMINSLEKQPEKVASEQITDKSLKRVGIGRIDIDFLSGKKSDEVIISL
jgi:nitroimidazol reductase NimA-like FMN-containing flavoprotein (pyridoxamine 5'-phosphate oxidase superfamily)